MVQLIAVHPFSGDSVGNFQKSRGGKRQADGQIVQVETKTTTTTKNLFLMLGFCEEKVGHKSDPNLAGKFKFEKKKRKDWEGGAILNFKKEHKIRRIGKHIFVVGPKKHVWVSDFLVCFLNSAKAYGHRSKQKREHKKAKTANW
ncbi:Uncharacterized protein APZ42_010890 [Daphnia magna]|uniref:Uncharacterized protein n=1 Tax=Daphnia magna TaxID=35525 RepID=A0A162T8K9_9CRUS|nr:Uncharacterized protein APZ42_010890 [Daphnia magna]